MGKFKIIPIMKNVLLLDTNISSAPIYNSLIEMNYNVFVIGDKPDDYLAKYSKNYKNINYSNVSKVKNFIKENNIQFLVPGSNDFSYKMCCELNDTNKYFGLESKEINEIINNKDAFREFALTNELPVPSIYNRNNIPNNISVIVKPVDSYSGNGVSVLEKWNKKSLEIAINKAKAASKLNNYLIEEFVEGQLYSHSAFIRKQKIYKEFFVEEHCIANPFAVDTSWVTNEINTTIKNQLRITINKLAKILNLKDGLIHTQFILNKNKFWIIEITKRCPGDLYSMLIKQSTGFNYAKEYAKPFIENNLIDDTKSKKQNKIIRHTVTTPQPLNFGSIEFSVPVLFNNYISINTAGVDLKQAPQGRAALLFLKTSNSLEFNKIKKLLISRKLYTIKEKF